MDAFGAGHSLEFATTRAHTPFVAAIDAGTNSCRILVGAVNIVNLHRNYFKLRSLDDRPVRIVDSYSRIVGLGEGLAQTGCLSEEGMERTLEALSVCRERLSLHRVERVRAVATEACRQARNTDELIQRALRETGILLEVISPPEEAQLVLKGCLKVMHESVAYGVMLDIGGGSTEIIWIKNQTLKNAGKSTQVIVDSISLPYGVVTLRDLYEHGEGETAYNTARDDIRERIYHFMLKNKITPTLIRQQAQVVASSGSVSTLASLVLGTPRYERRLIDGNDFQAQDLQRVGHELIDRYLKQGPRGITTHSTTTHEFLSQRMSDLSYVSALPSSDPLLSARIGLLAAGSIILNAILESLKPESIRIADRGVREGLLNQLAESYRNVQGDPSEAPYPCTTLYW